eukprot:1161079-Pelagomonas_calceolata.AAC.10
MTSLSQHQRIWFSSGSFDRRVPVTRGGRPSEHMNKIWPAWPSEHSSKEREQKTYVEGTQLKTWKAGRQEEHARCLAKLELDCFKVRHKD